MIGRTVTGIVQVRHEEQDCAPAVSSRESPPSVDDSIGHADRDVERELAWVDVMPESDRRLFAEEMSRLMAEAAESDDLAPVEQALREWRADSGGACRPCSISAAERAPRGEGSPSTQTTDRSV